MNSEAEQKLVEAKSIITLLMDWIEDHAHKPNEITEFCDAKAFLKKLSIKPELESVK